MARSAAERLFRAAEATFAERDGWLSPSRSPARPITLRVGIADLSHLGKLSSVRPRLPTSGWTASRRTASPRRALVLYPQAVGAQVEESAASTRSSSTRPPPTPSGAHGPRGARAPRPPHPPPPLPSSGEVAHVTAHVLPAGGGFRILVAQELGHYVGEVALDCAAALGGAGRGGRAPGRGAKP